MSDTIRRPILRSERLMLRSAEREDLPLFVDWLNDADVAEGLANRAPWNSVAEETWFEELQKDHGKSRWQFVICTREDERPIGVCGLHAVDPVNGGTELGIGIGDRTCWNRGYGTEAMDVLLDFAFGELRLHRVFLHVFDFNERARHVYEKVGFVHEGTEREAFYRHGQYHDTHVMAILRDEWLALDRPRSWDLD